MGMDNVKIMLFDVLYRLVQMVICLEVGSPWYAFFEKKFGKKRDQPGRCFSISRRKYGNIMSLRHLFLDKIINYNLRPTVILGRNRYPRWSYVRNFHTSTFFPLSTKHNPFASR